MSEFGANKRVFNTLEIDRARGLITKMSQDQKKLAQELNWYLHLPKECAYLSPRIVSYGFSPTSITMELYGYKALNTLWLEEKGFLGPSPIWDQIFSSIDTAVEDMGLHTQPFYPSQLLEAGTDMYLNKTRQRLEKLDSRFDQFRQDLIINERQIHGLNYVLEKLPEIGKKLDIFQIEDVTLIHGDLCLSNILYEPENGFIRVIDPRGSFGALGIYGDRLYEFAKLSHSFIGNYDFYINGEFIYEHTDDGLLLRAMTNNSHTQLKHKFTEWLGTKTDKLLQVKFIQSLLFLSMIPLHSDRPRSQMAFMCQGLQDFTEVVETLLK